MVGLRYGEPGVGRSRRGRRALAAARRRSGARHETARHAVREEHLLDANPPSRDAVEDLLIDNVVQKAAGQISPGRLPVRVLLARSTEVEPLNALAQNRRWNDWLKELLTVKPNRDRKRDAYRLHNLASLTNRWRMKLPHLKRRRKARPRPHDRWRRPRR
jgi:hypothetical protein